MSKPWSYPEPCLPEWPVPVFDLRSSPAVTSLREIGTDRTRTLGTPQTDCQLSVHNGSLQVVVTAQDPQLSELIATAPPVDSDPYLYEEDCLQLALALPGAAQPAGFLLLNACGSRRAGGTGQAWTATAGLTANGWQARITIPLPPDTTCCGLSVHRFYRGITGEIQSLAPTLPHPLAPADFAALITAGVAAAGRATADHRRGIQEAIARERSLTLANLRVRLKRTTAQPPPDFAALAATLAVTREPLEMQEDAGFLCWNEAHFQHALLDLWELTGDMRWLEPLPARIARVWSFTGTARNVPDGHHLRPLPTWYNVRETGTACTLVSGVILSPMARFIRLVQERPELRERFAASLAPSLARCAEVIAWHDFEWVELTDGAGMHLEPYAKGPARVYPRGGSRINPLNREFFLAMVMLDLAPVTGNAEYRRKATANALYFRSVCDVRNDCLGWEYETQSCPATGEDISHGGIQVFFLEQCVRDGVVFTESDLRLAAKTLARHIFRDGDLPGGFIRGGEPVLDVSIADWASLCRFIPELLPRLERVVATAVNEGHFLFTGREGFGVRVLSLMAKAQRQCRGSRTGPVNDGGTLSPAEVRGLDGALG